MRWRISAFSLALAFGLASAAAQDGPLKGPVHDPVPYPVRPVRLIVGFAPGSSGDVAARVLAQPLGRLLGQQFVVEDRTGAGSNIATSFVAHAAKDGYTLLLGTIGNTVNASYATNLNFDFLADFAPIVMFATQPFLLVAGCTTLSLIHI